MAQSVIYLPPGVVPPVPSVPAQQVQVPSGIPFDRAFFESVLPQAIQAFCNQADCDNPRVELLTVDGAKHFVNGISGVSDSWVALTVAEEDHPHPIQVFIPYQTIFRVEVHPEGDKEKGHMGFDIEAAVRQTAPQLPAASEAKRGRKSTARPAPADDDSSKQERKPAARKRSTTS